MYTNNAFYGNHLTAEAVSETEAYIYQYYPNGYIAKYSFTVGTDTGVEKTETPKATVIGGTGEITIEGEPASIEVYTKAGFSSAVMRITWNVFREHILSKPITMQPK